MQNDNQRHENFCEHFYFHINFGKYMFVNLPQSPWDCHTHTHTHTRQQHWGRNKTTKREGGEVPHFKHKCTSKLTQTHSCKTRSMTISKIIKQVYGQVKRTNSNKREKKCGRIKTMYMKRKGTSWTSADAPCVPPSHHTQCTVKKYTGKCTDGD